MLTPKDLCETMSSLIDGIEKVTINEDSNWVYVSSLAIKVRDAGIDFREYDCINFLSFLKCFRGLKFYRDFNHKPPIDYARRQDDLFFINRGPDLAEFANLGDYLSTYDELCQLALEENWGEYEDESGRTRHPILENYLNYTFQKLYADKGVLYSPDKKYAAFNTGLVDCRYLPIFALFDKIPSIPRKWHLVGFCISGENFAGKKLISEFEHLPPLPKYFTSINDLLYDTSKGLPALDVEHIILERTQRLPFEFLNSHPPKGFELKEVDQIIALQKEEREAYYLSLSKAIEADVDTYRFYSTALRNALDVAIKRVQWNYKSAIPMYYPVKKKMCLFLPLSLVHDNKVDLALVVERMNSGRYQGSTVYRLEWAYKCARLICRPDSDWLTPNLKDIIEED